MNPQIKIRKLSETAKLPEYQTPGAAGADVFADLGEGWYRTIWPGCVEKISTGLSMEIPEGFEVQVRPRSGLAAKAKITVLNSPGTIDSDYRGEVGILLINHGITKFTVNHGDRIAQFVVAAVERATFTESDTLSETERGAGGFGSTGGK